MATVDVLSPSDLFFEQAVKTVERWAQQEPSELEKSDFLREVVKSLDDPGTVEVFDTEIRELAVRALRADNAFTHVKNTLDAFVIAFGNQFPGIRPFQSEWNGYRSRWSQYIYTSRDFALKTAQEYEGYTSILKKVNNVKNKEDMTKLVAELREFSKNQPTGIPIDFKDKFLELRRDVEYFHERFNKYLDAQGAQLSQHANELWRAIQNVERDIQNLTEKIASATSIFGFAPWWGLIGGAFGGTTLGILVLRREDTLRTLDGLRAQLRQIESDKMTLNRIKAELAGLVPEFEILSASLGIFADIWNQFHNEAVDFAAKLEKAEIPANLPSLYKARVELAIAVSVPLTRSLRDYATTIRF